MPEQPDNDCVPESELTKLSNEALLDYIVEQRELGHPECAKKALGVLAFGYWDLVRYMVWEKVPAEEVDDVTATVMESALRSAFDGRAIGEFVNWIKVIAHRRIADFHRGREGKPSEGPLVEEHEGEEEIFGQTPESESEADVVHIREAAGRVLESRNEVHQQVIRLYGPNELGFLGLSARETAAKLEGSNPGQTMSEANVHQIWKRYKTDLERELSLGGS